jgi:hypothetical protein
MFEVISLNNRKKWDEIVCSMKEYDFYFLSGYHQLDYSGTPLLLYYRNGGDAFAMPLIVRDIEGCDYKDVTSVYGYAGPLTKEVNPAPESIAGFQDELRHFFDSSNIVSAFSRLHSLFPIQSGLLKDMGTIAGSNHTIGIDLTLPLSEQRKQYVRSQKYVVNKLRRIGITVQKACTKKEIDSFVEIYRETMDRVHASDMYYFSDEYFYRFLDSINSFIYLAYYEGEVISGALCTTCNGIIQYHLGATKNNFLYLSPLKLILEEIRLLGVRQGCRILHLGGGFKGDKDSLFTFKSRFSKQLYPFKLWEYVHNQSVYDSLLWRRFGKNVPDNSFFPLYRI